MPNTKKQKNTLSNYLGRLMEDVGTRMKRGINGIFFMCPSKIPKN